MLYTLNRRQIGKLYKIAPALFINVVDGKQVINLPEALAIDIPPNPTEDTVPVFEINPKTHELKAWIGDIRFKEAWRL